ncbi:hypothetical protein YC2023_002122 [Brassica napus]
MEAELGQQRAKCSEELTLDQEIASNEVEPGKWMTRLVQWGKQYNDDDDVQFYGVREECILLLSCKHMCLCKECERKLSYCLLCQSSKFLGIVIYTRRVHALAGTVETGKWMTRLLGNHPDLGKRDPRARNQTKTKTSTWRIAIYVFFCPKRLIPAAYMEPPCPATKKKNIPQFFKKDLGRLGIFLNKGHVVAACGPAHRGKAHWYEYIWLCANPRYTKTRVNSFSN